MLVCSFPLELLCMCVLGGFVCRHVWKCGGFALFYSYIFAIATWNTFCDLTDRCSSLMTEKH